MDFKGHQRLAARDSICAAAMTPLGRLGRQWNQTGLIFPQDWRYRPAHLCWEWDPSLDLHQIFIAPAHTKKTSVCQSLWTGSSQRVGECRTAAPVWALETFRKPVKGFLSLKEFVWGRLYRPTLIAWFFQSPHKALKPRGAQKACSLMWLDFKGKCFFLLFGNKHIYILIKSSMRRLITLCWWTFVL